jgi:hypothetical protein
MVQGSNPLVCRRTHLQGEFVCSASKERKKEVALNINVLPSCGEKGAIERERERERE